MLRRPTTTRDVLQLVVLAFVAGVLLAIAFTAPARGDDAAPPMPATVSVAELVHKAVPKGTAIRVSGYIAQVQPMANDDLRFHLCDTHDNIARPNDREHCIVVNVTRATRKRPGANFITPGPGDQATVLGVAKYE